MSGKEVSQRSGRMEFQSRVRIAVSGAQDIEDTYAANLSDGGMFIRDDRPPPVGSLVAVEFVLPDGTCLGRIAGRVVHARPAIMPGEKIAGMGLQFVELDAGAEALVQKLRQSRPPPLPVPEAPTRRLDLIELPERPPLIGLEGPVVGIDLGTVNSCVAVVKDGKPQVITSRLGYQIIPSVVYFGEDGVNLVGHRALEKMVLVPGRAVHGSKRFLGRPFASKEVRALGHFYPYELVSGPSGRVAARIGEKVIPLEQVSALVLASLKQMAEGYLQRSVQRAIICVPAYFGETQRQAVRDAARMAGLYVERIMNEPTAAAVAYGWNREGLGTVAVYDLGGGTFDVSVLRVDGQKVEVLDTDGDPFLGGSDFDDRITEYVLMRFERQHRISLRKDVVAVQRIRFAAELAKKQLSDTMTAELHLPYICKTENGFLELRTTIDRETLESLTHDLVDRTFALLQRVLDRTGIKANQIDDVLLVGGQTRSPHVRRMVAERFARPPTLSINPDEAVAIGAAIIAEALYSKRPVQLTDVLPLSIRVGVGPDDTRPLFARGSILPVVAEVELESVVGEEQEYRLTLYRGEHPSASQNTLIGTVRLPSSHALALAGTKAKATVRINAEGMLSVEAKHPMTGKAEHLETSLI